MKIRAYAEVQAETVIDIPDEDLLDCDEAERERVIWEYVDSWVNGSVSAGYKVLVPVVEAGTE